MTSTLASIAPTASQGIPENVLPIVYIALVIAILGIGIAVIAIILDSRNERSRHETVRMALEKGMPIPPDLLSKGGRLKGPSEDRRNGLILIGVGIGVFLFFRALGMGGVAYVAAILVFLGFAFLVNWVLDKSTRRDSPNEEPEP